MPSWQKVDSNRPQPLVGTDEAATVTNGATSGTLYIGGPTVSAGASDYSIAAGASRVVKGPAWGIGSTGIPVTTNTHEVHHRQPNARTRWWTGGIVNDDGAGSGSQGGTNTTRTALTAYLGEVHIAERCVLTGIRHLNGATVGTDDLIDVLYDHKGNPLAWSAIAGTASSGANAYQALDFTAPYEVLIPGRYFIGVIGAGTTATIQVSDATVGQGGDVSVLGGTQASAWTDGSAPVAVTVPTTVGAYPIASTY